MTVPCEEVLLVVAGSPHLPIRHNKTSEPSSGWLNNSSLLLLHTGDGATVTCVNSNPSHNIVCTPQAGTQGYIVSKKKISSLCLNSNMSCAVLAVLLCLLQQVSDMEPPPSSCISFAPLGLPAAECDAQWQTVAYMLGR